ncbi:hypothetical protein L316_25659 [Escherichia coli SHECO002]|nr:hypothetical protein L316_25659 [Escherichia coli SHECO002]
MTFAGKGFSVWTVSMMIFTSAVERAMLKMEQQLALIEDETQAAVFSKTVKQIKQAYRQ